jgi:hypothetical protein
MSRLPISTADISAVMEKRSEAAATSAVGGTIARKHGSATEIYETSKDLSTSVVPVFFEATGEIRFFDRSVLEDVVAPAS